MGLHKAFYYLMYAVGFALMTAITLRRCTQKGISKKRGATYTLFTFFGGLLGAMVMGVIYTAAARSVGLEDVSYVAIFGAVIFTPLLLLAALGLEKRRDPAVNIPAVMDCITPGSFTVVICGKFGCFLYGCCYGVQSAFGIWNPLIGQKVFPVQLFEVLSMLVILLLLAVLQKRAWWIEGLAYPVTAAIYAAVRFGWEFLRAYPAPMRHFIFGMTLWQFCCVLVFAVSAAVIACICISSRKETKILSENKFSPVAAKEKIPVAGKYTDQPE
ncbi:MAG: prolipoprotein diacylglyceryl transferase [Clostridia bacterium]|nr:prolipoprotein diacylglyceryl transferase [Clostridia bacterium]